MIPISEATRAEAWLSAAKVLYASKRRIHNLIVEAKTPDADTPASRDIELLVNTFLKKHDAQPLHTVAETIFPAVEYRHGGIAAVLAYPETVYPFIKPANPWGTYALRMTNERHCKKGLPYKPLEALIAKLRHQLTLKSPKLAVYELGLMSESLDMALYDADADHENKRGGQCLSHISIKLGPNQELYLTAMYRYQWFVQKALGNFLGLARLQACIARELGIPVGPLVCHATLAVLDDRSVGEVSWKTSDLGALIKQCDQALHSTTEKISA